jgi:hypothetical protein
VILRGWQLWAILPVRAIEVPPCARFPQRAGAFLRKSGPAPTQAAQPASKHLVGRNPTLLETLCRTLQWLEKTEDLDRDDPALKDLKRAILLQIANLEIKDKEKEESEAA